MTSRSTPMHSLHSILVGSTNQTCQCNSTLSIYTYMLSHPAQPRSTASRHSATASRRMGLRASCPHRESDIRAPSTPNSRLEGRRHNIPMYPLMRASGFPLPSSRVFAEVDLYASFYLFSSGHAEPGSSSALTRHPYIPTKRAPFVAQQNQHV